MKKYLIGLVALLSLSACGPEPSGWVAVVRYSGGQPVEVMVVRRSDVHEYKGLITIDIRDKQGASYSAKLYGEEFSLYPLPNYKGTENYYIKGMSNAQDL